MSFSHQKHGWKNGTPLSDYHIVREIYHGSRGAFYEARRSATGERAALIVVRDRNRNDPDLVDLDTLLGINHPNIASIREGWYFEDLVFYIGELSRGRTLEGPDSLLPSPGDSNKPREIARCMREIAAALSHAHRSGITHQDLRMQDIVIREDGRPVLVGLGWAHLIGRPGAVDTRAAQESRSFFAGDVAAAGRIIRRLFANGTAETSRPDLSALPRPIGRILDNAQHRRGGPTPYNAEALWKDLDAFLSPRERPAARKKKGFLSFLKERMSFFGPVLAIAAMGGLALLALAGLVWGENKKPSLENRTVLAAGSPRECEASEEALGELLFLRRLDPTLSKESELMEIAGRLFDQGCTETSDRLLDRMIDWFQGDESSWEAYFLQRRIHLESASLRRLVSSLESLLNGPLRLQRDSIRKRARSLLEAARAISLKRYHSPGSVWSMGDFLSDPGEERARVSEGRLTIRGSISEVTCPLQSTPFQLTDLPIPGEAMKRLLLVHEDGSLVVFDGESKAFSPILTLPFEPRGRLKKTEIPDGGCLLGFDLADQGVGLVELNGIAASDPFTLPGERLCGLEVFGTDLLVMTWERGKTLLQVCSRDTGPMQWSRGQRQEIQGFVSSVVPMDSGREFLLGINEHPLSGEGALPTGIYRLVANPDEGEDGSEHPFVLHPFKPFAAYAGRSGAVILDSCRGDLLGGRDLEAVFLVRFPGMEARPPETRILLCVNGEDPVWYPCTEAFYLYSADLDGRGRDELLLSGPASLVGVTFSK